MSDKQYAKCRFCGVSMNSFVVQCKTDPTPPVICAVCKDQVLLIVTPLHNRIQLLEKFQATTEFKEHAKETLPDDPNGYVSTDYLAETLSQEAFEAMKADRDKWQKLAGTHRRDAEALATKMNALAADLKKATENVKQWEDVAGKLTFQNSKATNTFTPTAKNALTQAIADWKKSEENLSAAKKLLIQAKLREDLLNEKITGLQTALQLVKDDNKVLREKLKAQGNHGEMDFPGEKY